MKCLRIPEVLVSTSADKWLGTPGVLVSASANKRVVNFVVAGEF